MSEGEAETLRERIQRIFRTMNGFGDIIEMLPEGDARAVLSQQLSRSFGLPDQGSDDTSLKKLFMFCRMKLDQFDNADEYQEMFVRFVMETLEPMVPAAETHAAEGSAPEFDLAPPVAAVDLRGLDQMSAPPAHQQDMKRQHVKNDIGSTDGGVVEQDVIAPPADSSHAGSLRPEDFILWPDEAVDRVLPTNYPSLLFPCPHDGKNPASRAKWLSGEAWGRDAVAIGFHKLSHASREIIAEADTEMSSDIDAFALHHNVRFPMSGPFHDEPDQWLETACEKMGMELPDPGDVAREMTRAAAFAITLLSPMTAGQLARTGARLVFGADAAKAATHALALERSFLKDNADQDEFEGEQILLGTINPARPVREGDSLIRAFVMHSVTGRPLADCLIDGLSEFRHAQVIRKLFEDPQAAPATDFHEKFLQHCVSPLDCYILAKNEAELVM